MQAAPVLQILSGERLHLSHGPIDVVLRAWGPEQAVRGAYAAAWARFQTILPELCAELPALRTPMQELMAQAHAPLPGVSKACAVAQMDAEARGAPAAEPSRLPRPRGEGTALPLQSAVARRMYAACLPFADVFVTPMAAVAGAVADELLACMAAAAPITRAFVNDGGDIAVRIPEGQALDVGLAGDFARGDSPARNGHLRLDAASGVGGIATSGARGRSFSLGIADSVTVLARDAATADVAATLVANAVDVASPAVARRPACTLDPDSDLGERLVTVHVGALRADEIAMALDRGLTSARRYAERGLIIDAALLLSGRARVLDAQHAGIAARSGIGADPSKAFRLTPL